VAEARVNEALAAWYDVRYSEVLAKLKSLLQQLILTSLKICLESSQEKMFLFCVYEQDVKNLFAFPEALDRE